MAAHDNVKRDQSSERENARPGEEGGREKERVCDRRKRKRERERRKARQGTGNSQKETRGTLSTKERARELAREKGGRGLRSGRQGRRELGERGHLQGKET